LAPDSPTQEIIALVDKAVAEHVICSPDKTALEMLTELLKKRDSNIVINDQATCGLLQYKLSQPGLKQKIHFIETPQPKLKCDYYFSITGLDELWEESRQQQQNVNFTNITIEASYNNKTITKKRKIPFRNRRVIEFAVEYSAYIMRRVIQECSLEG